MDSKKNIIGYAIKSARENKSLTQEEVANKIGISRSYLSDLENGRYTPSSEKLILLTNFLNMDMSFILEKYKEGV